MSKETVVKARSPIFKTSLQIIFFYKPVICQARDKVLPDIESVWSDKNIFPHLFEKKLRE